MASIHSEKRPRGTYYRLKVMVDGEPTRTGLGYNLDKKARRSLEVMASKLESLHDVGDLPDPKLLEEINRKLSEELLGKFAEVGLLQQPAPRLEQFLAAFIETKVDITDYTRRKLRNSAKRFVEFFGDVRLSTITLGDASDYVQHRRGQGVAETTVAADVKHGRQFFGYAIKKRYLAENPFADESVKQNPDGERLRVIGPSVLSDVLESAPTADWRVFLGMVRYLGCRKSEALLVKWDDILWDQSKVRVPSPKSERYGKGSRLVPLFPELRPFLDEAFAQAKEGSVYVVNEIVSGNQRSGMLGKNLYKPTQAIIKQAGHEPWPKLFQNLRVTRENELERRFPSHVVQSWIGHSRSVAEKNYLTVTDEDFQKALSGQSVVSTPMRDTAQANTEGRISPDLQSPARPRDSSQKGQVLPLGLEVSLFSRWFLRFA